MNAIINLNKDITVYHVPPYTSLSLSVARACPYTNLTNPEWNTVAVDMSISRAPGTNITYSCVGDMMMEGSADGQRTAAGVMQCLEASDGSLAWDWIPTLPCTCECASLL